MQNTQNIDRLGGALVEVHAFLSSPQRDEALLREAGVVLDRALFPLLVALSMRGPLGVAELADGVGRDHTTVSRQLAKLESLDLACRRADMDDRRRHTAAVTVGGKKIVRAIGAARRRLLSKVLADWAAGDVETLTGLLSRFAEAMGRVERG